MILPVLWAYTPGHRRSLVGGLAALVAAAAVEVLSVLLMADVLDGVLGSASVATAIRGVAAWVGVTLLGAALTYIGTVATCRAAEGTVLALRDEVFARLLDLPLDEVNRLSAGDVVVRLTEDVVVLETALSVSVVQAVIALLTTVGLVTVGFWLSWQLTAIALIAVPVLMGLARAFRAVQERVTEDERAAHSALGTALAEVTDTVENVRLHTMEPAERAAVHERGAALYAARLREARAHALFGGVLGSAQTLTVIAVTVAGVALVRTGALTYGALVALTGYLAYLYPRIQDIAESRLALVGARISADRLVELVGPLGAPAPRVPAPSADGGGTRLLGGTGIRVRDLRLERERFVLDCPAFAAGPGALTAILGPSGAGKSSLALALAGLTGAEGTVDVGEGTRPTERELRDLVTLVPQRAVIRAGTIASNISYGNGSDPAWAAGLSGADEFIGDLPDGFGTVVPHGGDGLSGGQRQRIALARGLARATPVLVLDEPSTGLDGAATRRLVGVLRSIARRRTVVVITHDPILIAAAERRYEVRDGRVVEARAAVAAGRLA